MDGNPTTLLAQPFQLAAAATVKLTVGATPYTATVGTANAWYRTYLAASGAGGTAHTDAKEWLAVVQAALNASGSTGWVVRLRTDGRVEVTNTTASTTYAVQWDGSGGSHVTVRDLLGFAGNVATTATGTYTAADYLPSHCWFLLARTGDKDWQAAQAHAAWTRKPDGTVYGFAARYVVRTRTFDTGFHPTDKAAADALGSVLTPLRGPAARWQRPSATPITPGTTSLPAPWSVEDFAFSAGGYELGCAFGTLPDHLAGATSTYDACYLDPDTLTKLDAQPTQANWSRRRDVRGVKLRWAAAQTR